MMKKIIICIISIVLCISCKAKKDINKDEHNNLNLVTEKSLTQEEIKEIKNKFYVLRKILIEHLENERSLFAIQKYLNIDFLFSNTVKEEGIWHHYKGDDNNLKLIDKEINFDQLLDVLKKGEILGIDTSDACMGSDELAIDFIYNFDNSTWEIATIRYEGY